MLKKAFCIFLALITLFLCACNNGAEYPEDDVPGLFLNAVKNGNYTEAYSFLSEKCIPEENCTDEKKDKSHWISLSEFTKLYTDVFNAIGFESLEYSVISEIEKPKSRTVEYSLKYHTSEAKTLEYEFTMDLLKEDGSYGILWSPSLILPDMTRKDIVAKAAIPARRGDIVACGQAVATNINLVTVYAVPAEIVSSEVLAERIMAAEGLEEPPEKERLNAYLNDMSLFKSVCGAELSELYTKLSELLEIEADELEAKFDHVFGGSIIIEQYYPDEIPVETCRALEQLQGIRIDLENFGSARYYPYGKLMAHNIGYMGSATQEEVDKYNEGRDKSDGLYNTDSYVGKTGLEKLYEKELRGKDGYYIFLKSPDGTNKKTLYKKDAEHGADINISIDFKLQQRAEELLDIVLFGDDVAGTVIVMNPKTGAVQALASNPSYDLNAITRGLSTEEFDILLNAPNKPMFNRSLSGRYPPGSTFKVFTAAAALDLGVMNENYIFNGKIENDYWTPRGYGHWIWPPIKRTKSYNRLKPLNMMNCMIQSDNIYFANAALKIGQDRFIDYLEKLGMASEFPFELNVARSKIVNDISDMNYKLLADTGYGQGELLISPLQLATMYCAFRNEGSIPAPYIVESMSTGSISSPEYIYEHTNEMWKENVISPYSVTRITKMLQEVVNPKNHGTGRSLRVKNCEVAGKTGTAEVGAEKGRIISWFTGFRLNVPEEDERLVLVVLEVPDKGVYPSLKFQIARSLLEIYDDADINEQEQGTAKP